MFRIKNTRQQNSGPQTLISGGMPEKPLVFAVSSKTITFYRT
jgi:hypothetical protein